MSDNDAAGAAADDLASPPPPAGAWRAVRSDMQAIFGAGHARARSIPLPAMRAANRCVKPRGSWGRLLAPLIVLTGAAGAVAGLVVVAPLHQPVSPKIPTAVRATAPEAPPLAMAASLPASPVWPIAPIAVRETASEAPSVAAPSRSETTRPQVASVAPEPEQEAVSGCDGEGDAHCSRSDVIAADRDLRLAYLHAIDAGVDRGRLVAIRNRWARLRATEYDRPADLLADYAELADRLELAADYADNDLR